MWDHWMCGPQCCAKFMNIIDFGRDGCAYSFFLKAFFAKNIIFTFNCCRTIAELAAELKVAGQKFGRIKCTIWTFPGLLIPPWSLGHIQNSPSSSLSPLPDFPEITDHAHSHVYSYFCWIGILVHKPVILQISFPPVLSLKMVWSLYTHAKK